MKISGAEKGILALAAVFLLLTIGFFAFQRGSAHPYTVSTQKSSAADVTVAGRTGVAVNINTADVQQLQQLPGVGRVRAQEIVLYREENGPFRVPEDIGRVPGIGQGTVDELLKYITVG